VEIQKYDPDLAVSPATRRRIERAVSPNTRRAYAYQLSRFTDWCAANGRTSLPATGETLAEFVSYLCDLGLSASTIEQTTAAIRTAHRVAGHKGLPDTVAARLVLRSHRRDRAEQGQRTRKAPPITLEVLRKMIEAIPADSVIGLRDRALLVLGFALMGRRSELAALNISDVEETEDGLLVTIRMSKTDQDAVGETVAIPRGTHPETDPVRVLRAWLTALGDQGVTEGPLLRSVTRWGRVGASLTTDGLNRAVRAAAVRADLSNAETFTAHSLRAGGATSSYKAGAPVSVIAAHGRWAENSPVVLGYIRAVDRWVDNPMRGVGL
jgi:integrase